MLNRILPAIALLAAIAFALQASAQAQGIELVDGERADAALSAAQAAGQPCAAAAGDIGERGIDGRANLRVVLSALDLRLSCFQTSDHWTSFQALGCNS